MKSDIQFWKLFQVYPNWVLQLARMGLRGRCRWRSVTIKALERRTDGVLVPDDENETISVVEIQDYLHREIYTRIVDKMVGVQVEFGMRKVEGIIFFGSADYDPRTEPWCQIVHRFLIRDEVERLARETPHHPLVATMQPLLLKNLDELKQRAPEFIQDIQKSSLEPDAKATLEDVFISWFLQKFRTLSRKEVEAMLLTDLPPLEETVCGKELIEIGERRGEARGEKRGEARGEKRGEERGEKTGEERALRDALLELLASKPGRLTKTLRQRITRLHTPQLRRLFSDSLKWDSCQPLANWLDQHTE